MNLFNIKYPLPFYLILAFLFLAGCAGKQVIHSYWSKTGNSLPSYSGKDNSNGISWTVANDSRFLYVSFNTNNRQIERMVMFRGVTLYLDPSGKEKKNIYLRYPYRTGPNGFYRGNPQDKGERNGFAHFQSPMTAFWNKGDEGIVINRAMEHTEFKYHIKMDSLGFMNYQVRIPLHRITNTDYREINKLDVGIVINRPQSNSNYRNRGGFTGRERGEGGERGGYGDRDGGRRPPVRTGDRSRFQPVNVNIWFVTRLAQQPS